MNFKIDIEEYLNKEEIRDACKAAITNHAEKILGVNETAVCTKIARQLVKEQHQIYVKNHRDLLEKKIVETIDKITLGSLFFTAFGWSSGGHKILKELLIKNKDLLEKALVKAIV